MSEIPSVTEQFSVRRWHDPIVEACGFPVNSIYTETVLLPILGPSSVLCLRRLGAWATVNPDGTLDAGFGTGGTLTTPFNGDESVGALLVQPDGKIVAAGFSENNTTGQIFIALARYNP